MQRVVSVLALSAASLPSAARAFSRSTTFCRPEADGEPLYGCPTTWPSELCTVDSGETLCKCPSGGPLEEACIIGTPSAEQQTTGRCAEILVKVLNVGSDVVVDQDGDGSVEQGLVWSAPEGTTSAAAAQEEFYCRNMQKNDQWADYVRLPSDGPASHGNSWSAYFGCWSFLGKTWRGGECLDSTRYIGESCWDGAWWNGNPGQCKSDSQYSEHSVSCYEGECTMFAQVQFLERQQCDCGVSGGGFFWIWFACSSSTCDGHACVLSTRDLNHYCDYATAQTVAGWFR